MTDAFWGKLKIPELLNVRVVAHVLKDGKQVACYCIKAWLSPDQQAMFDENVGVFVLLTEDVELETTPVRLEITENRKPIWLSPASRYAKEFDEPDGYVVTTVLQVDEVAIWSGERIVSQ